MINLNKDNPQNSIYFLNLGFRPFFFVAAISSIIFMIIWFFMYQNFNNLTSYASTQHWHAHEMIFAYIMAVIVGFLLTAVKNWTKVQTIYGKPLLFLSLLWLLARILPFIADISLLLLSIVDISFLLFATIFIAYPIIKTKSWGHIGIISKLLLMSVAHIIFYLGLAGILENGILWGMYSAFYLILALIFVMARRVIPFFIENGVNSDKPLKNYLWIDRASLILFIFYLFFEVFWYSEIIFLLSFALFMLHSIRIFYWYHKDIWKKTLLWSLYLAYIFLISGFLFKTLSYFINISPYVVVHSFAIGIGMMTISMMSRVSLGHTGRSVFNPPKILFWIFLLLVFTFIFRIIFPLLNIENYILWIGVSQILWVVAFLIFAIVYTPMLFSKRLDGLFG